MLKGINYPITALIDSSTESHSEVDSPYIHRCIELARQALGRTAPNPLVGAIVVADNQIVGEGFHPRAGASHAEVFALQEAGDRAWGATVYVNLEPCNHYGRTPPCTEALIAAGVKRVVVGMVDPDPRVSGGGIQRLREAGIEVKVGVEEKACQQLNEAFIHRIRHQLPWGIFKYAMTLDGKIATTTGHSQWVTGEASRRWVHQLRGTCDAVIVGGNTVRKDNPQLTTHGVVDRNPVRMVMSRSLNLPRSAQLWELVAPTVVLTEQGANPQLQTELGNRGVEVVEFPQLTPRAVMEYGYQRGFLSVLWECGGQLGAQAIASGMVQKVYAFIAPKIIGGDRAPSPVGDLRLTQMTEALSLTGIQYQSLGSDILIEGYLVNRDSL
ncbi:bifunctional diaminohydroxyphosphoribosylaminopyrimidine deaminase/5-amino-6-(5-phosphoribosylamino)uracil reductase RibD [Roseofilum sp. Guam]|uniref:bifunctional diaminohydroxyphosphoribosylaminopyrimidine deaminase/5-amino-6-(5-phosphoribosylamino)uracil reductase RibD n=1 Tax=Roseofilum sp. Guam TaxID=2821502 RepID=UPI00298E7F6F|nr:bifunctional diaminohydroxyphosphoribosylaminopyrimidine deaminase/5-amino-6-(5-phosphoribosylamino)uracil reductase RibD [Roseofilum sp. Guam]